MKNRSTDNETTEYSNSEDTTLSEILTLVEKKYGSGALFAVADLLEEYDDG